MKPEAVVHPFPAFYRPDSGILILGSFPSVKSREMAYFYGHPQNRYWKVLAALFDEGTPMTVDERREFLLRHHVAAWDVIASCTIEGSSDASIRDVVPNDLRPILGGTRVRRIFVNGKTAERMFRKYTEPALRAWLDEAAARAPAGTEDAERFAHLLPAVCLPSTSPANAAWSLERLTEAWKVILNR
ncbi:MAG: DNA-deoxyinosine glycosylase [Lachnospiraceae bacterium]|nr:DNA-deoxyinosine glycosylase [Lachnospiraceae bacterium]